MRYAIFVIFLCLFNLSIVKADDDDLDEEITIDESPAATSTPAIEKGTVPTIKSASSNIYFEDQFQDKSKWSRWVKSQAKKDDVDENLAKYDGEWGFEIPQSSVYNDDYALILKVTEQNSDVGTKPSSLFLVVQGQTSCYQRESIQTIRFLHQPVGCSIRSQISNQSRMRRCLRQIAFARWQTPRSGMSIMV